MNAYLTPFDLAMERWLTRQDTEPRAAFLRFADDMILLAEDPDLLLEGIDTIWDSLCHPPALLPPGTRQQSFLSRPSDSEGSSNLRISWSKVEPASIAELLDRYLEANSWSTCKGCDQRVAPEVAFEPTRLHYWFKEASLENPETGEALLKLIGRDALFPDRLEPFSTFLVERFSTIGSDSIFERFGRASFERLTQLHELVRLDIKDQQIREDTRLSFAANRLVRAWLDEDSGPLGALQLEQVRRSIELAVRKAPWKFNLWTAVVKAAARRPIASGESQDAAMAARRWLQKMLSAINFSDGELIADELTLPLDWGEEKALRGCFDSQALGQKLSPEASRMVGTRRNLVFSALRTAFWRALASTIREVASLRTRLSSPGLLTTVDWPSDSWTFRAFSEDQLQGVLEMLSGLSEWVDSLYPKPTRADLSKRLRVWRWEGDALSQAILACTEVLELATALEEGDHPGSKWRVSSLVGGFRWLDDIDPSVFDGRPALASALALLQLEESESRAIRKTSSSSEVDPWTQLLLARRDSPPEHQQAVADLVVKRSGMGRRKASFLGDLNAQLHLARAFRVEASLPDTLCRKARRGCVRALEELAGERRQMARFHLLEIYSAARLIALSLPEPTMGFRLRAATLHRLLWADPQAESTWKVPVPASMPAVGLPTRIALRMFNEALKGLEMKAANWPRITPNSIPAVPIWQFFGTRLQQQLREGRAVQLGLGSNISRESGRDARRWVTVSKHTRDWEVLPHPTYLLPWALGWPVSEETFQLWCHILLFQTAIDGSENGLDTLLNYGVGAVPLTERWGLRSKVFVPEQVWSELDGLMRAFGFRAGGEQAKSATISEASGRITNCLSELLREPEVSTRDFLWERVDIRLELAKSLEVPLGIRPFSGKHEGRGPFHERFELTEENLQEELTVRLAQIRQRPDWPAYAKAGLRPQRKETQLIMRDVVEALSSNRTLGGLDEPHQGTPARAQQARPSLVVFPELAIPRSEIRPLVRAASHEDLAIFTGLLFRIVPSAISPHRSVKRLRLVANDSMLAVPLRIEGDHGPAVSRYFNIEKPVPSHLEHSLAQHLSETTGDTWRILAGRRWFRFVHPSWGDFTVAICSDLLDPSPWASLRGEFLHLVMCADNPDVSLYEALTWTRAYENYVNVVAVNQGDFGGSMVWSPKRKRRNEIARLLGNNLSVTADVQLVVRELWKRQFQDHGSRVVDGLKGFWCSGSYPAGEEFKSPPPGFPFRGPNST